VKEIKIIPQTANGLPEEKVKFEKMMHDLLMQDEYESSSPHTSKN